MMTVRGCECVVICEIEWRWEGGKNSKMGLHVLTET